MNYATKAEYDAAIGAIEDIIKTCTVAKNRLIVEQARKFPAVVEVVNNEE